MIGGLFLVNAVLAIVILFTSSMLQNHFTKLEKSIAIYTDTKAYKPERYIDFISKLIERYKVLSQEKLKKIDIETMILKALYEEKVGKFFYVHIQSIALQGRAIMWAVLVVQITFEILGKNPGQSISHFIYIVASTFLCMIITLMSVFKSIRDQRDQLVIKMQDYIVNAYPVEVSWKNKQKNIKELLGRIEKLENELESYQNNEDRETTTEMLAEAEVPVDRLKEEDIKNLLEKFDLNL